MPLAWLPRSNAAALLLWALLTTLPLGGVAAAGNDDEIARAHFATGTRYYDAGRFAEAAREFLEAHRLSQRASLLYNAARAFDHGGDAGRATRCYERYLAAEPRSAERVEIEARLFQLSRQVGKLAIRPNLDGVELFVDGERVEGPPGEPLPVTAGRHHVEGRRAGFGVATADVEVAPGLAAEVPLVLLPSGQESGAPAAAAPATVAEAPKAATPAASPRPRWLWPLVAGGAAVVAAGVIAGVVVGGGPWDHGDARALCDSSPGCVLIE